MTKDPRWGLVTVVLELPISILFHKKCFVGVVRITGRCQLVEFTSFDYLLQDPSVDLVTCDGPGTTYRSSSPITQTF